MLTHCPQPSQHCPGPDEGSPDLTHSLSRAGLGPAACHDGGTSPATYHEWAPTPQPVPGRSQSHSPSQVGPQPHSLQVSAPQPVMSVPQLHSPSQVGPQPHSLQVSAPQPITGSSRPHGLSQAGPNPTARHRHISAPQPAASGSWPHLLSQGGAAAPQSVTSRSWPPQPVTSGPGPRSPTSPEARSVRGGRPTPAAWPRFTFHTGRPRGDKPPSPQLRPRRRGGSKLACGAVRAG